MTKRPHRNDKGMYVVNGKQFKELFGSRQQVMNGTAYKTAGELTKSHLLMNKWGRIVSRKKHATAKKEKRLLKHGFTAKKGKFGVVKIGKKMNRGKKSRKVRGGANELEDAEQKVKDAKQKLDVAKLKVIDAEQKLKATNLSGDDNSEAQKQLDEAEAKLKEAQTQFDEATAKLNNLQLNPQN